MMSNSKSEKVMEATSLHSEEPSFIRANGQAGPPEDNKSQLEPAVDGRVRKLLRFSVGLGGQGKEALKRLKSFGQKLLDGLTMPDMRFLEIDNDETEKEVFEEDEFLSWNNVPAGDFLRSVIENPDLYPGLARFGNLQQRFKALNPTKLITGGNGCDRFQGTIVQEYQTEMHGAELESALMTPVKDLLRPDDQESETEALTIECKLGVSGSLGNTAVLKVAWLHQFLLAREGLRARLEATFYFPEMLKTSDQESLRAHTHAFLLELKAIYDQTIDLSPLKIGRYEVPRTPVFSMIKLVNAVDKHNRVYSYDEAHAIETMCWYLSNFGPIAAHLEKLRPNIEAAQYGLFNGYAQGCQVLVVPVAELKELFTLRQQQRHARHWVQQLQPEAAKQRMKHSARTWLEKHKLTPQAIGRLIASAVRSHDFETEVRALRSLKLPDLKLALKQYRQKAVPRWREQYATAVDELDEELGADLIAELTDLPKQVENRLPAMRYFLEDDAEQSVAGLSAYLSGLESIVVRQRKQMQVESERHLAMIAQSPSLLKRVFYRLFPQKYKNKLLNNYLIVLTLDRRLLHLDAQAALIKRRQQDSQHHRQGLVSLESALRQSIPTLADEEQHYNRQRRRRPIYEENILTSVEEEAEYFKRIDQAFQASIQGSAITWQTDRWVVQCREQDQTHHFDADELDTSAGLQHFRDDYLKPQWHTLEALDIETILERRNEDVTQLIERLKRQSSPMIAVDQVAYKEQQRGRRPISLRREYILATPHGQEQFFRDYTGADGFEIVPTGSAGKHWIALLNNLFHVNPLALEQSKAYREAYLRQKATGRELHIFDESELELDNKEDD